MNLHIEKQKKLLSICLCNIVRWQGIPDINDSFSENSVPMMMMWW